MKKIIIGNLILTTALLFAIGSCFVPLRAQMRDSGGMMGGGASSGGSQGGTTQTGSMMDNVFGPMFGLSAPFADSSMMGTQMGMNASPFVNNGTLYTLIRDFNFQPGQVDSVTVSKWVLSAYDLNGVKLWALSLTSDLMLDPVFGPDGKIFLVGHQGMGNLFARMRYNRDTSSSHVDVPLSSTLHIITTSGVTPTLKDIQFDGEWASNVSVANKGDLYWVYLSSQTMNLGAGGIMSGQTTNTSVNQPQQFLYGFDSQGNLQFKNEIK
jgi:hypothetical protein